MSSSTLRCGRPRGLPRSLRHQPPLLQLVPDPTTAGSCHASPGRETRAAAKMREGEEEADGGGRASQARADER
jgi:hypothetical protein